MSVAEEGIAIAGFPRTTGITKERHTLKELRDVHVVRQHLDFSCGAAALATLMSYYYGEQTSEQELLDLLDIQLEKLTPEQLARKKRSGFSLLDLKNVAQQKGYRGAGVQLSLAQLRELVAPVIVYLHPSDYHHFAVLRGIAGDRVFLADPSRGNLRMSTARFLSEYGGVVFVLGKPGEEDILTYPLALVWPDDYAEPELRTVVHRFDRLGAFTVNMAARPR
ncbi:MAG: C39 family peptidase [Pseudomonadota bacterium]|nr:C39 family peptidase [Pseudomonadota bacterium]